MSEKSEKKEVNSRAKILSTVAISWNSLIDGLVKAKKSWDTYSNTRIKNLVKVDEFPLDCQKIMMLANPHGDFSLIIEDMVTRGHDIVNHLEKQKIKIK